MQDDAPLPDERPTRRREYSGAGSTLGVAALIVMVVGVTIWFFEIRDGTGRAGGDDGFGVVELPEDLNTTGKAPAAQTGRAAPDFELAAIEGGTGRLSDHRGKFVLVNFWASWCPPCRGETPDLQALSERAKGSLIVIGVNQQERLEEARAFAGQFGVTYPVLLDSSGEVSEAYRVGTNLPMSYLVDPAGVIQKVYLGALDARELAEIQAGGVS